MIGLPGETIEVKNGKVYADGVELDNSFLKMPQNRKGDGIYIVPEGCYFFLGDNRNHSNDSRFWDEKYVPLENIQAKARFILLPFDNIGSL
ncbi:signal peptidase I [Candidatus Ventrimonas sp. KK005]